MNAVFCVVLFISNQQSAISNQQSAISNQQSAISNQQSMDWTTEKVASLAPDFGAEQRGRALAALSHWQTLGKAGGIIWGECKGSGSQPYRTHIDTQELAFGCSCPTRSHPCKHGLGLLFLLAQSPNNIAVTTPPDWVQQWIDKRRQRQQKNDKKNATTENTEPSAEKLKRQEQRLEQITATLQVFEQWLADAVRQGVAQLPVHDPAFWERISAQLADAGMNRLRQSVKTAALYIQHHNNWTDYLLERVGEWFALVLAFRQRQHLSALQLEDILNALGRNVQKKEVLANGLSVGDQWYIVGQYEGENIDGITFRQVWLYGIKNGQYAYLLDYKFGEQTYEHLFVLGSMMAGSLVYYPSQFPQRAVLELFSNSEPIENQWKWGFQCFADCQQALAEAIAVQPFIEDFPVILTHVTPLLQNGQLMLMDSERRVLPVNPLFEPAFWQSMAYSGGSPITLFATFDGKILDLYSIFEGGRWRALEAGGA